MEVEIIFHTSSTPKKISDVVSIYTKGALLCVQLKNNLIIKYPLINIFSIAHYHGEHLGSTISKENKNNV